MLALPSAIKWRIIKKVIPLNDTMRISSRSHIVAPNMLLNYWPAMPVVAIKCLQFVFTILRTNRKTASRSDSFIQYSKRLNVHLISCFSSSFSKISYKRSLWDSFFFLVSSSLILYESKNKTCWRHQKRIWNEVEIIQSSLGVFMHKFLSSVVLPDELRHRYRCILFPPPWSVPRSS